MTSDLLVFVYKRKHERLSAYPQLSFTLAWKIVSVKTQASADVREARGAKFVVAVIKEFTLALAEAN
jgi:hypothetical protein